MRSITTILILLVSVSGELALADNSLDGNFFVAPSMFYYNGDRSRSSSDKKTYLVYDLKFAYRIYGDFFAGLAYQSENETKKTSGYSSASLNNSSKATRTSYGPSIGYVLPTYHFVLTYYYASQWNLNTTTNTGSNKYSYSGWGFQFDMGYKIALGPVLFGPQLSYKSYTYGKLKTDGGPNESISPKLGESNVEPSLILMYAF